MKSFKTIKLTFFITLTIVFSIIGALWFLFYNIFIKTNSNNSVKIEEHIQKDDKDIKKIKTIKPIIKENKEEKVKKIFNKFDIEKVKENIKNKKDKKNIKNNISKIMLMNKFKGIDNKTFSFFVKYINKSFLVFIKDDNFYIVNINHKLPNLIIRNNYKENIKNILFAYKLNKDDNTWITTIDAKIKTNINIENTNISWFLNWFLIMSSYFHIDWKYIVILLNIRNSKYHPLNPTGIKTSFNVNKILYINSLYENKEKDNEFKKLFDLLSDLKNYKTSFYKNNVIFVNFNKIDISYLLNNITKKVNKYNYYKISIDDYIRYMYYIWLSVIYDIINNKDKNMYWKDTYKLLSKNNLFLIIKKYYYRAIKIRYPKLEDSYTFYKSSIKNHYENFIPMTDKKDINSIQDFIKHQIVFHQ